jgi:hypothetical protein
MFLDEIVVNPALPPPGGPPPLDGPAGAYRRAVLDRGPVCYWTFDEDSGAAADWITGQSGNQLAPQGGAGRVISDLGLGKAADFNGAAGSRFFTNTLAAARTTYEHYAVECWVRLGNATGSAYLLEGFDGGTLGNSPALIHGFNPNLEGFFAAGGRTGSAGPATLADRAWHHVVLEVNVPANTHSLFIDGVAAGTFPGSRPWRLPVLGVGSPAVNTSQPMTGQLDELAIYDLSGAAFTAQDLAGHHAVLTAAGPGRLILSAFNPATSELGLSVVPVPPGRMFHLRGSTDLRTFHPLEPPVDFDMNTPQPLVVRTHGEPRFFVQAYEGASP